MTSSPTPLLTPDLYQALWQHSTDLVSIIDAAGIVRYASPSYRRTLGYDPAAIIGTSSLSRIHSDDRDRVGAAFQEAQHQPGAVVSARFRYQHADGSWRVLEVTGANHLDDPVVRGFVVNGRDVTAEVEAYVLLEQRVTERTRELSTVLDVSRTVASTLELQPLLSLILDSLHTVVDSVGSSISAIDGDDLVMLQSRGPENEEHLTNRRYPAPHDQQLWQLLLHGEPVIIEDVRAATPLGEAYRAALGADLDDPGFTYVRAWMGVPLRVKDRVVGTTIRAFIPCP